MPDVPRPGPAKLQPGAGLDAWLEEAKQCHYLPEPVMKQLCEMVKEVLMEGEANDGVFPLHSCFLLLVEITNGSAQSQISSLCPHP